MQFQGDGEKKLTHAILFGMQDKFIKLSMMCVFNINRILRAEMLFIGTFGGGAAGSVIYRRLMPRSIGGYEKSTLDESVEMIVYFNNTGNVQSSFEGTHFPKALHTSTARLLYPFTAANRLL